MQILEIYDNDSERIIKTSSLVYFFVNHQEKALQYQRLAGGALKNIYRFKKVKIVYDACAVIVQVYI